jgi:hypothetical protein
MAVAFAVSNVEEMKTPPKVEYVTSETGEQDGGYTLSGGFGPGVLALFGMLFVGVGTAVATASATTSSGAGRAMATILALAWHGVGIGACWCYCSLAPERNVWPFLLVAAYEWVGLIPLGCAMPKGVLDGRLRSAVWYAMLGAIIGGFAGAVIGGLAGGAGVVVSHALGREIVGANWWLYATMGGGVVTGAAFALRRLGGWEMSSGEQEPSAPGADPEAARLKKLRTRRVCVRLGIVCVIAALVLAGFQLWLGAGGKTVAFWLLSFVLGGADLPNTLGSTAQTCMFWLLFASGLLLLGFSRLLKD